MGANQSLPNKPQRRSSQSKYVLGKKSSSSISSQQKSPSIIQHSSNLVSNRSSIGSTTLVNAAAPVTPTERSLKSVPLDAISDKRKGKLPADSLNHLDTLSPMNNSAVMGRAGHHKRIKSQNNHRNSTGQRERYNSIFTASNISNHDGFQFSAVADSVITDMSRISFNSFMDNKSGEDNDYVMYVPDFEYPSRSETSSPSTDNVSTTQEILDLLTENPGYTYDILTDIFSSPRIRNNPDLQREAFNAAEVWSSRPDDVSAKICVARCKLCGWGTIKNPRQGFRELELLAAKKNWEAYYYLAQCCSNGVEQAPEGFSTTGTKSNLIIQPVDQVLARSWYKKVINTPCDIQSDRISYIIAQAKLLIAISRFDTDQLTRENLDESIGYVKDSATAGNR